MVEISSSLSVVLVEDNENDRLLFREAFQKSDIPCDIAECTRAEEAIELLAADASSFDVVAVDNNLPGISGMDLCRKLLDNKTPLPLVLLTEMGSERLVAEALRAGVHDYIIKDPERGYLELLPMSLKNVVRQYDNYRYYMQINEMRQDKNQAASAFLESIPDTAGLIDTDGNVLMVNKAGAKSLGRSIDEMIGKNANEIILGDVYKLRQSKWMEVIQTGKTRYLEDERDGKYFETWFYPIFDAKGKVVSIAIFAHDITDRKKTENALKQSDEKFRLAMEVTNDALWDWNMTTNEVYRNPRHATMLGYEPHELAASQDEWEKRIHPDDRQALIQILKEHIDDKRGSLEIEYRLKTKSGDYVWVLGRGKIVEYNNDGSPARMVGTNIDITERKRSEEAGTEYQTLLRGIMDNSGSIVAVRNLQGQYLMVNTEVEKVLGMDSKQIIGKTPYEIHSKDKANDILKDDKRVIESRNLLEIEDKLDVKGETRIFQGIKFPLQNAAGEVYAVCTVAMDITKHKKAEEALQESELQYRTLFETLPVGVGLAALDGRIIDANSTMLQMTGFTLEEIKQSNVRDVYHNPDERTRLLKQLQQDGLVRDFQVELKRKDGSAYYSNLNVTAMTIRDETVLVTVARDVTEQKRMERSLAESEEKYRTLVEGAGDPIFTIDERGVFLFANKRAEEDFKDRPGSLVGKTLWDLFPKEMADRKAANVRKVISTGKGMNTTSLSERRGKPSWYNITIEPLRDEQGNTTAAMIIARNVDDMKRAEEQIKKLSSVVEQSIDGIAIGSLEKKLLYVNDSYAHMHGYTPQELIGMKISDLFPADKMDVYEIASNTVDTTGAWTREVEHVRKDGSTFPAFLSVTLQKNDKGEPVGHIAICRDMTQYKRTQEILDIKNAALESSINGIVIGNIEGNLTYVNNSFLEIWGYDNESEVLGRNAAEFWKVGDKAAEITEAMRSGEGWIGELTAVRKDGSKFDIQVCQTSIRDENGKIISLMGSFVDISESKQREEQLIKYREQMARAEQLASLGTLSATVAHQLTQPLTVIRLSMDNALDELEATSSSETVIRKLKDSVIQVSNITSIIERFRNFARKSSGRTFAEVDLKAVAVRIAKLLSESARSAGIILRLRNMNDLPCPWMNETDLEQLFFALIENAIQAADGKKARQLVISGSKKGDYIELSFSDNCGGIEPENLNKIFEPFFTTKPRGQGTGLGLCIVQDVVSRIGGHVRVENKFGKGTTFIISLPADQGKIS